MMNYQKKKIKLFNRYPAIADLAFKAESRIPNVAWQYLETGTGTELLIDRNRSALDEICLIPQFCKGPLQPTIQSSVLGQEFDAPFGVAPIGLTGLMWPKAECLIAEVATSYNLPFSLSTVATETPESLSPHINDNGWFQLYPPKDKSLRKKILNRAEQAGFTTLLVTADVPVPSRRERTKRAGLQMPPRLTPQFIWEGIKNPVWSAATLSRGLPRLRLIEAYSEFNDMMSVAAFAGNNLGGNLSWDYCSELREEWDGPIVIKGLLNPKDVHKAIEIGMDGIVVSNHGARQFDGAPAPIEVLPHIHQLVDGKIPIIYDGGIRSGLDILKALRLGADFVLLGRAFLYGVAALGKLGVAHVIELLKDDLMNNMIQCGVETLDEIREIDLLEN